MTEEAQSEGMMIFLDPPEHTALRRLVSKAFTPRRVAELEEEIRSLCASLLMLSRVRTASITCRISGPGFRPRLSLRCSAYHRLTARTFATTLMVCSIWSPVLAWPMPLSARSAVWLFNYIGQQIEDRGQKPRDDMLTDLVQAEVLGSDRVPRRLTPQECTEFGILIISAGTETVARLLGWAGLILADHPEQLTALAQDASLIPNAVEELLRYEAPSPVQGRWLTEKSNSTGISSRRTPRCSC